MLKKCKPKRRKVNTVIENFLNDQKDKKISKVDKHGEKVINIDFDGVIHAYSKGFHDGTIYDGPAEGVREALEQLARNYILVCFSARCNADPSGNGKREIIKWLKKYDLLKYFSDVTDQKRPSICIIDDSAIRHTSWKSTMEKLKKLEYV